MKTIRFKRIILGTVLLLLIPLLGMLFTEEMAWGAGDFIIAATLLLSAGFAYEYAAVNISNTEHQRIAKAIVIVTLVVIWLQLAVGLL